MFFGGDCPGDCPNVFVSQFRQRGTSLVVAVFSVDFLQRDTLSRFLSCFASGAVGVVVPHTRHHANQTRRKKQKKHGPSNCPSFPFLLSFPSFLSCFSLLPFFPSLLLLLLLFLARESPAMVFIFCGTSTRSQSPPPFSVFTSLFSSHTHTHTHARTHTNTRTVLPGSRLHPFLNSSLCSGLAVESWSC